MYLVITLQCLLSWIILTVRGHHCFVFEDIIIVEYNNYSYLCLIA